MDLASLNDEGYLIDPKSWTKEHALTVAKEYGISLTTDHWRIIQSVRAFYLNTGVSPSMRPLVTLAREVDPRLGSSLVLAQMFTNTTSKVVAQLSGTPKPSDCI